MPAATKTAQSNNRNKKNQSFLSRLIPTTRKAKMITLVAAFAVVGGGFMVYRSFAATVIATANAEQIQIHSDRQSPQSTKTSGANGATKANFNVWKVPVNGTLQTVAPIGVPANTSYQICYTVQGVGRFYGTDAFYGVTNGSAFQQYCGAVKNSGPGFSFRPTFQNNSSSGNLILKDITIQVPSTSTPPPVKNPQPAPTPSPAPAPAPQPSK